MSRRCKRNPLPIVNHKQSEEGKCFIHRLEVAMTVDKGAFSWSEDGLGVLTTERMYERTVKELHPNLVNNPTFANLKRQFRVYMFSWDCETTHGVDDEIVFHNRYFTRDNMLIDKLLKVKTTYINKHKNRRHAYRKKKCSKIC